jgi:hypothetical protein
MEDTVGTRTNEIFVIVISDDFCELGDFGAGTGFKNFCCIPIKCYKIVSIILKTGFFFHEKVAKTDSHPLV